MREHFARQLSSFFKLAVSLTLINFAGCSGCSQSGVRHRAERNIENSSSTNYSSKEPVRETIRLNQPSASHLPLNQLFRKYQPAVFLVYTSDGEQGYQGTGFFISSQGLGISNYHVFEGTSHGLEVLKTVNGEELKVETASQ